MCIIIQSYSKRSPLVRTFTLSIPFHSLHTMPSHSRCKGNYEVAYESVREREKEGGYVYVCYIHASFSLSFSLFFVFASLFVKSFHSMFDIVQLKCLVTMHYRAACFREYLLSCVLLILNLHVCINRPYSPVAHHQRRTFQNGRSLTVRGPLFCTSALVARGKRRMLLFASWRSELLDRLCTYFAFCLARNCVNQFFVLPDRCHNILFFFFFK